MTLRSNSQPTFPKAANRIQGKSLSISKELQFDWYEVQQYLDSLIEMIDPRVKSTRQDVVQTNA